MSDKTSSDQPNFEALFAVATGQAGYFTAAQARMAGYGWALLSHHARQGRFLRVTRGLYRLRDYPASPHEDIIAAWLPVASHAVVSHESALDMLGLSDVVPDSVHLSVPRARRNLTSRPGVTVHTTTRAFGPADTAVRAGVRVTAPERTIADVAEGGTAPEQVALAVRQAVQRQVSNPGRIRAAVEGRGRRVRDLVESALAGAMT